ncbi:MAG: pyruvate dehydrogenase (acetyl-transferring) E1 component subunit alpha [Candidatus Cloacimonadota bacterium]|nr:MAG: pyruvate dehydrogenase (acetyl-transferring) E1 component subunit alpha [Candidatus Cloacimonadota bacterium]PIE81387.1 MAG: pyruvate dehydrogenase (acetyl-transferring) E1 component subunit alpha [Candidatus Delongbacteria bacterium]
MNSVFEKYKPIEDALFQVMDNDGKVINEEFFPKVDDEVVLKAYKDMLFERMADLMIVSYQRQGRIYTYPPNYGQEGIHSATSAHITNEDWLVPAFRELGVYLSKGVSLKEIFLYYMGNEEGSRFKGANRVLPISVPIASQLVHAAGLGYAMQYKDEKNLVYAFVGDGGTSEGDFHEALNFAGVWKAPVIFIVQNNQYAISVPFSVQTASKNIAVKSEAYGIKGIKVDGNDFFAMYKAIDEAKEASLKGEGPILIEALTYRKGPHTTSDDPTKYRTKEEESEWEEKDPVKRLKAYLIDKGLWSDEKEEEINAQYKKEVDRIFREAEKDKGCNFDDVFKYIFTDIPQNILDQKAEYEKFLKWRESRGKK